MMKKLMILFLSFLGFQSMVDAQTSTPIDSPGFANLTNEVNAYRAKRLIKIEQFNKFAKGRNTIILDTRSKKLFEFRLFYIGGLFQRL